MVIWFEPTQALPKAEVPGRRARRQSGYQTGLDIV